MSTQTKAEKPTVEKAAAPKVLAVFHADCRATKGLGSTIAVVQGGSSKCRLYGKDALAKTFPDIEAECRTLTTPDKMADYFSVAVVSGMAACLKFMADRKLRFAGAEKIIADQGKGNRKRGGAKALDYATF